MSAANLSSGRGTHRRRGARPDRAACSPGRLGSATFSRAVDASGHLFLDLRRAGSEMVPLPRRSASGCGAGDIMWVERRHRGEG